VLSAFGVTGEPLPLPGGEGRSVRVGRAVLKPVHGEETEARWRSRVLEGLRRPHGFHGRDGSGGPEAPGGPGAQLVRVPMPLRTRRGEYVAEGWAASEFVRGTAGPAGRWAELLRAGREFHEALCDVPRPDFLDERSHPWAVADRVAWGERSLESRAPLDGLLRGLFALRRPVDEAAYPAQIVHGDLTGNVLFAEDLSPAVIDFSPYWRPVAYADAIVVADGLLYWDADRRLAALAAELSGESRGGSSSGSRGGSGGGPGPGLRAGADFAQMLVRALIFRLATLSQMVGRTGDVPDDEVRRFTAATELTAELTRPRGL
jgi:hypothetical protein